jgi:predicted amidohydrolase
MSKTIKLGLFQFNIVWNDIKANQQVIINKIEKLPVKPELFILPEMYSTGFYNRPAEISEKLLAGQLQWQLSVSDKYNLCVLGSVIEKEDNLYHNRFYITYPDGRFDYYDKRHLFSMGGEDNAYSQGKRRITFQYKSVIIMPQICYDLRFPVWSRNDLQYDLLIYSANWPAKRRLVWDTLLKARAIENQCYAVGVNRVGIDGNSVLYNGGSAVYGPKGETIVLFDDKEQYSEVLLSIDDLKNFRESFPVHKDADEFQIKTRE